MYTVQKIPLYLLFQVWHQDLGGKGMSYHWEAKEILSENSNSSLNAFPASTYEDH